MDVGLHIIVLTGLAPEGKAPGEKDAAFKNCVSF